jgi:hypothetical protein
MLRFTCGDASSFMSSDPFLSSFNTESLFDVLLCDAPLR